MNIYKLTTDEDLDPYDHYDSVVVVANSEKDARLVHPSCDDRLKLIGGTWFMVYKCGTKYIETCWATKPELVNAELIGIADSKYDKPQVICASFNAG